MKTAIRSAERNSNKLIGEERLHTRNQDILYAVRTELAMMLARLDNVYYDEDIKSTTS